MPIPLTARVPVEFVPIALALRDPPVKIKVRVPTMYERDAFSAALVRGGVIHYSRSQIRELMLAGVAYLHGPEAFDDIRADLENLWDSGDAFKLAQAERSDKLIELLEQNETLPESEKLTPEEMQAELDLIQPTVAIPESTRVRITAIQQDITSRYVPLQKVYADLAEQDVKREWLCVEMHVLDWTGLQHQPDQRPGGAGLLRHEAEYLRGQIGQEAFTQLADFIFAMQSLDEDEEKNLALLIENSSAPTGLKVAESMGSSEAGQSEGAPISPIPDDASPKTTETSSGSTSIVAERTEPSAPIQTEGQSSTSL